MSTFTVPIRSDSNSEIYSVIVRRKTGRAISCSCPAYRQCKHTERAELTPAFLKARGRFEADMSRAEFTAQFLLTVEEERANKPARLATNRAIKRVIKAASTLPALEDCRRCGGTGIMPYPHVCNGVCFRCQGLKVEPKRPLTVTKAQPKQLSDADSYQRDLTRRMVEQNQRELEAKERSAGVQL